LSFERQRIHVELDNERRKHQDESLLHAHTSHVYVLSSLHGTRAISRVQHRSACALDNKGEDVKPHEPLAQANSFDAPDFLFWMEKVYQAAGSHVHECIDPQWCEEEE
jgi:hypothetical protein